MKKCPFCAEEVRDLAVKCKHCQSALQDLPKEKAAASIHSDGGNNVIHYLIVAILATFYMGAIILSPVVACFILLGIVWFVGSKENFIVRLKHWRKHGVRVMCSVLAVIISLFSQYATSYPNPVIEVTSGIEAQGDNLVYTLQFQTMDVTSAFVNGQLVISKDDGSYSVPVNLDNPSTVISIVASNAFKKTSEQITIERDMTTEETAAAKALADQLEAEQRAWDESEAGKICAKYPSLTNEECVDASIGRYSIGMKKLVLFIERGAPDYSTPSNYGSGQQWQWCWTDYTPSCFYDRNDDGIIDSYN
ncbi:hypothetical protein EPN81_03825 [Patescibacteria group bacterium]|nr:MAG: hypothetical protein EPN81_03825 [Patescibacteria group bacterium]